VLVDARSSPTTSSDHPGGPSPLGEILTLDEVAQYLKISKKTVYKIVNSGDLRAFKAGKHWRVLRAELGAWTTQQIENKETGSS
jgi:excisionase family DNA binding protein